MLKVNFEKHTHKKKYITITDLCNDDIDQRKYPKPIPHKRPGFHTQK